MSLDLGELLGTVDLIITPFQRKYGQVVGMMSQLGTEASKAGGQTVPLERGLAAVGAAGDAAATGLGRAEKALAGAGLSASEATAVTRAYEVSTSQAALASSKLTQAELRLQAAQARLNVLQESGKATTAQLAGAQASLIAATDRVAISQDRVAESTLLGARSAAAVKDAWGKIPGPVKVGAAALAVGAVEAVKAAANYQLLVRNLQTGANESQANLKMVGDGMLHMAGQVGFSADTLAKAMFFVESAGFHGAAGLKLLKTAAEGAKVDFVDLPTMVDALTSAMNAYHEPAANAARVTNTLIASAAVGKMHLQDLAAALGTVLPSAAALRVPLDQVGAAMATMTMQGTNAQRAATYLRFAFAALANPTSKAQAAMAAVGLTSTQVANTMTHGGLPAVFALLEDAVGRKFPAGSARYLASLANMVGGTRGLQAVLELTGKNLASMNGNLASIDGRVRAAGNSVSDWADVQHNFNLQLAQFIDGLGAAGIKIGEDLLPAATALLHLLNTGGHAVGDVAHFFDQNRVAADALALVLLSRLVPAIAGTVTEFAAMAGTGLASVFLAARSAAAGSVGSFTSAEGALAKLSVAGRGVAGVLGRGGMFVGAVGLAAAAVSSIDNAIGGVSYNADAMTASLTKLGTTGQITGEITKVFGSNLDNLKSKLSLASPGVDVLGFRFHSLSQMFSHSGSDFKNARDGVTSIDDALKQLVQSGNADIAAGAWNRITLAAKQQGVSLDTLDKKFPGYLGALQESGASAKQAGTGIDQYGNAVSQAAKKTQSATDAAKSYSDALHALADPLFAENQALTDLKSKQDAYNKAVREHGRDSAAAKKALEDLASSSLNVAAASRTLTAAVKSGDTSIRQAKDTLHTWVKAGIMTQRQANDVASAWGVLINKAGHISSATETAAAGMQRGGAKMTAAARNATAQVLAALRAGVVKAKTLGNDFGLGYALGIANEVGAAGAEGAKLASAAVAAARSVKGQHSGSPSRKMFAVGLEFGTGYARGIASMTATVTDSAARLAAAAVQATRSVYATLAASVAPTVTDPTALAGSLGTAAATAVNRQRDADMLKTTAEAADEAAAAAKRYAQALANEAHAAQQAAANLTGTGKAAAAAKHAAEVHARALGDEARAASQEASKASAAASKETAAWNKASQAAQTAAQTAADAASALVSNLQSAADQMTQTVQGFMSQISGDISGDDSLSSLWQQLTGTDDQGNPVLPTIAGLQASLNQILTAAQGFSDDLNSLVAEGASQDLITQLADMGTSAGDALAKQLLAAGPGAVAALQSTMTAITKVAGGEAQKLSDAFYGPGEKAMIEFIDGLKSKFPALAKALGQVAAEIQATLGVTVPDTSVSTAPAATKTPATKKPPKITTGPFSASHGFGHLAYFAAGTRNFAGGWAVVGERGPEIVALPAGSSVYPHGSDGAALLDLSAVTSELRMLRAEVARLAADTGQAVGTATLTGFREAGQAHARQLTRDQRKR